MSKQEIQEVRKHQIIKDDEIDLIALIKTIWEGRKTIYYSVGVCVFIGLLIAFLSPAKYTASATLLPSSEKMSNNLGGLGALAGMAGVNLSSMMGQSEGIPTEIYPQVINSYPFLNEFVHEKFHFEDYAEPISIYDYVVADTIPTLGSQIVKYTIGLPWTLKDAILSSKDELEKDIIEYGVLNLSEEEIIALDVVFELLEVDVDDKTGLVKVSVEVDEPLLAAQYVQNAVKLLQDYVIEYKTQQVRENLKFVQERYVEKKEEYEHAQMEYFNYKDAHRNIVSERMDPEFQRLNDVYDIASTVYKSLAQQLEQAKISVKEETPVFTVLEPAKVPFEKSSPNTKIILVLSVFLGGFIGFGIIFGKILWNNIKKYFN
ncbi:Wzz/FepE/Etk N-terminal domain-containing protein [Saccharicrinis sp. GN24d3]|uniref:Wzz/FepE/Etk N-terminal domain-containing protein n=1 Tax=Saccharicrinis sp. GN24d3 TaxID=3458416 RepID=UPI004037226B